MAVHVTILFSNLSYDIKLIRQHKKMNIREAAKDIGVSPASLSRLENGNTPDVYTMAKVCFWLNRPIENYITHEL